MNRFAVVVIAALAVLALAFAAPEGETYSNRYDNVDLEVVLQNPEKVDSIVNCFSADNNDMCSEMAGNIKKVLPEILKEDCAKCNEVQKKALAKIVTFLSKKKPEAWTQLQTKYDPDNVYKTAHPEIFQ